MKTAQKWWETAVCYQIYIRSFSDASGDGVGDMDGITERLPHVAKLGADAIWITPFYPSPMADHGYDVADYYGVDPMFGDLAAFDRMLARAHELGIRVIVDIVPNHSSDQHEWFRAAVADPSSPMRDRYIFRDPKPNGDPPNNWNSVFGGPAWTLDERSGQYYLHLFAPAQPDFNWRHPAVKAEFDRILKFWLDRGVDGFRIDVAHGLYKDPLLRDNAVEVGPMDLASRRRLRQWNRKENRKVYVRWRKITDSYSPDRTLVGEVHLPDPEAVSTYLGPDRMHQAFSFAIMRADFEANSYKDAIERVIDSLSIAKSPPTWVLSNHDFTRHVTRYGGGDIGRRRSAAALMTLLALPGSVYLYQGEELGLEESEVPAKYRQDPIWFQTNGKTKGRDGCRTPIPWEPQAPGYGFTANGAKPWLPFGEDVSDLNAATQWRKKGSMLNFYARAIAARRQLPAGRFGWKPSPEGTLVFTRGRSLVCATNFSDKKVSVPGVSGQVVLASAAGVSFKDGLILPAASSAWIRMEGK